jgi:choline kinase
MGDHWIEEELVKRLVDRQVYNETLCVDYTPALYHELAEATKVEVDGVGSIKDIGKELNCWDALDTGVFLLTENFFQALHELVHRLGTKVEITDVVRFLISQGHRFDTCDISGCSWIDVDTEEDLNMARV